jgi:hypothetical protein
MKQLCYNIETASRTSACGAETASGGSGKYVQDWVAKY